MQITVDLNTCESHGSCVFAAPEVFSFDDDDHLQYEAEPDDGLRAVAEKAAASCPVRAITVVPAS
ncbi:ferredoxin [Kitasatospora albolonga]|uniref:Ferredoxin n=1 Tax=Kitasatospora albolonga TaxID=68173 RepID=A0ABC8BX61_9ACTN|nr:ferredoxin [Kitasatospora albolonga]